MMLTMKEVAQRLKISVSLAYRLVAKGELPCYEIASCKRVDERELQEYLEQRRVEVTKLPDPERRHF